MTRLTREESYLTLCRVTNQIRISLCFQSDNPPRTRLTLSKVGVRAALLGLTGIWLDVYQNIESNMCGERGSPSPRGYVKVYPPFVLGQTYKTQQRGLQRTHPLPNIKSLTILSYTTQSHLCRLWPISTPASTTSSA